MNEFNPLKLKQDITAEELQFIQLRLQKLEEEKQQLLQSQVALNNLKIHDKPTSNQLNTDQKAVALGKSCNAVFHAQISSQNREARYIHPTGDQYLHFLYLTFSHF